jgi:hypothetical protein
MTNCETAGHVFGGYERIRCIYCGVEQETVENRAPRAATEIATVGDTERRPSLQEGA